MLGLVTSINACVAINLIVLIFIFYIGRSRSSCLSALIGPNLNPPVNPSIIILPWFTVPRKPIRYHFAVIYTRVLGRPSNRSPDVEKHVASRLGVRLINAENSNLNAALMFASLAQQPCRIIYPSQRQISHTKILLKIKNTSSWTCERIIYYVHCNHTFSVIFAVIARYILVRIHFYL